MKSKLNKDEYNQKLFELQLELLCEYKIQNPNKTVYLTQENLTMIFNNYKQLLTKLPENI